MRAFAVGVSFVTVMFRSRMMISGSHLHPEMSVCTLNEAEELWSTLWKAAQDAGQTEHMHSDREPETSRPMEQQTEVLTEQ